MERISGHFANIIVEVKKRLEAMNMNVDNFRVSLTSHFNGEDFISSISSVSDMIDAMKRKQCWDYYNYQVLEGIIKHFGKDDSEMIGWMEEYKTRLMAFKATTKIADYIKDCTDDELKLNHRANTDYKKLYDRKFYQGLSFNLSRKSTIRIDENCLTYIDEEWTFVSDHFLLPPLPILLEKIVHGQTIMHRDKTVVDDKVADVTEV